LLFTLAAGCGSDDDGADSYPRDGALRLNQMQVLGSHNSYHIQAEPSLFALLAAFDQALADSLEYTHIPLQEQFETQGIRQIELDVFADPQGGLYAGPIGLQIIRDDPDATLPGLDAPGFKVLHVQEIDYGSTCPTLVACLQEVKNWSDAHPQHAPIMILIEAKDEEIPDPGFGFLIPLPIRAAELDALDAEILSVFPRQQIILPDDVRGDFETLERAVRERGWPTLRAARGRILFALDNGGDKRDAYIAGHPSLSGRVMFTSSFPGEPEAAFAKLNDPIGDFDLIQELVGQGFIVRTRADADTLEARSGDTAPRDAALASGAQFVSTDYPVPNPDFGTGYQVLLPGGMPARCNPITAAESNCTSTDIEDLLAGDS
jgi:hypothetical protein